MAYATSSVGTVAALLTFIQNTATANGWTLSGEILHKGTVYVRVWLAGGGIAIQGGTGKDGSNNLTGACAGVAYLATNIAGVAVSYPLTAEMHINTSPDEVFVVINYATSYYGLMAWGLSDVPGIVGTGIWYHANATAIGGAADYSSGTDGTDQQVNFGFHCDGAPLFNINAAINGGGTNNSWVHHDIDSAGWSDHGNGNYPSSARYVYPLNAYQPNAWNGEAVLLPYPVYFPRASLKYTLVADFKHIRHVRIDFLEPGEIITLGPDKWKCYPFFQKSLTNRDGGSQIAHSGTLAYAVRYTGP